MLKGATNTDALLVVDTILVNTPAPKDSALVKYITQALPIVRTDTLYVQPVGEDTAYTTQVSADSASVIIPITQKMYETEDYKAYVSGYKPNLDSIFVYPKTAILRETPANNKSRRWHIGVTAGAGYGVVSRKAEPFIGVGITYSIISF